jgi:HPr kinase/phosphorylase
MPEKYRFKTVSELYRVKASHLGLKLAGGVNGLENQIDSPRIQKLGLALAGYTDYLRSGRVQSLGRTEMNFLNRLGEVERKEACRRPFELELACIVITSGLEPPQELREYARQFSVPILLTDSVSTRALDEISEYLEEELAPTTSIHAVLMEVLGLGVLLVGKSGIGKSECGLELVLRGHRLVSDDMVNIKRLGTERLVGAGPDFLRFHMELRGLGIINIRDLFGISSVSLQKQIDLAIELVRWRDRSEGDRIGFEEREYQLLETSVPLMTLPVASGRNVATLVEVAVRIHMLKKQGYEPGAEFLSQLEEKMRQAREE